MCEQFSHFFINVLDVWLKVLRRKNFRHPAYDGKSQLTDESYVEVRPAVWRWEVSFFLGAELHYDQLPKNISRGMMGDPERGFLPVFGQTLCRASLLTFSTLKPRPLRQRNPTRLQCTTCSIFPLHFVCTEEVNTN